MNQPNRNKPLPVGVLIGALLLSPCSAYSEFELPHPDCIPKSAYQPQPCQITAESNGRVDVLAAIEQATPGQVVCVPGGAPVSWDETVVIRKGVVLQGGPTTILFDVDVNKGIANQGLTTDSAKAIFLLNVKEPEALHLTGFHLRGGTNKEQYAGVVQVRGTSKKYRISHNSWQGIALRAMTWFSTARGVVDNNDFLGTASTYIQDDGSFGKSWGDGVWENPVNYGTDEFIFFENNFATEHRNGSFVDGHGGAKSVVRCNDFENVHLLYHGNDSGGIYRGGRAMEIYRNHFREKDSFNFVAMHDRGGTFIAFDNKITGRYSSAFRIDNYRSADAYSVELGADGTVSWDTNDRSDGAGTPGGAGDGVFATGVVSEYKKLTNGYEMRDDSADWTEKNWNGYTFRTIHNYVASHGTVKRHAAGYVTETTVTVVPDPGWTANQFSGHHLSVMTSESDHSKNLKSFVNSNTSDTLVLKTLDTFIPDLTLGGKIQISDFAMIKSHTAKTMHLSGGAISDLTNVHPGTRYEIRKVVHVMDSPGMGVSSPRVPVVRAPHQSLNQGPTDPTYVWNNFKNGELVTVHRGQPGTSVKDVHYFEAPKPGYMPFVYPHPLTKLSEPAPNTPVSIVYQPQNQNAVVGKMATFTVYANGSSPMTYQWKKNGVDIVGATNSSYKTAALDLSNSGEKYSCVVKNLINTGPTSVTTREATLSVTTKPIDPPPGNDDEEGGSNQTAPPPGSVQFGLFKNFFNPNKGETLNILLESTLSADVEIRVMNTAQQEVITMQASVSDGSSTTMVWNGRNKTGSLVASGTYVLVLKNGNVATKKKVVVVK